MTSNVVENEDTGYGRLERQIVWYDNKSVTAQRWYKSTKLVEIALSAAIPFIAGFSASLTAVLGVSVVIIEVAQQLFQWHHNWITYRATCEALKHEKYSFLGGAGIYDNLDNDLARKLLVDRVEGLISVEHSKWLSQQNKPLNHKPKDKAF